MRRLLTVFALCCALSVHLTSASAPLAMPFFDVEDLKASGIVAAGRFGSLIDQQSLYVVRLTDGMPLVRIDDVGPVPFDLDGGRLVYVHSAGGQVVSVDLASHRRDNLWTIPDGSRVAGIHVFDRSVLLIVEDGEGTHATWSENGTVWSDLELPNHLQIKALIRHRIVAADRSMPGRLLRATITNTGTSAWTTLYESRSSSGIDGVRPLRDGTAVTFLEREGSGSSPEIVRVPVDTVGPSQRTVLPATSPASAFVAWSSDYLAWPERHDGRLFLNAVALAPAAPAAPTGPALAATRPHRLDSSAERSVAWLERQLSQPFVSRHGRPARLIDSYEDGQRAGWIYDAALASIAFVAVGETSLASELLAGLEHLQRSDGSWISSFDPDTRSARGSDRYVGAMAWVVMAVNFFEAETGEDRFAPMARRGLTYLERYRITDARSDDRGAFRMGPSRPATVSTEHNVDGYSAFFWRGRLESNQRDLAIADGVRGFIVRQLWVDGDDATRDGHFRVGAAANGVFLDAQTWTTLGLSEPEPDPRLAQALRSAERVLGVNAGRLGPVKDIRGFDESDASTPEKVWAEGSEGMVAALLALGDLDRARRYHAETARYQSASGGIPYATENTAGWTTAPSVAATGWYVLNSLNPARNPFHPRLR